MPSFEEAQALSPMVGYVPIASSDLLAKGQITLLGGIPLEPSQLDGYTYYLKDSSGMSELKISELVDRLIEFSAEPPLKLRLSKDGTGLRVAVL
mmetsp:Transcript_17240/g.37487  ORF Transcript_17240/g.37487 Transcript_17240/m.37487 type:complete len:94 (-) Transcript_17240:217-498(-)